MEKATKYLGELNALTRVRTSNDIGHWVRFFLQAVAATAESGKLTFQKILALRQEVDKKIVKLGRRAENARRLITHLYVNPAVSVKAISALLDLQYHTANQLVAALTELGILVELTGYQRNRIFFFQKYVDIFRSENGI